MGRKAFQKPFKDGVKLIETVQEVYKNPGITIA
jgi:class I fructose-bisphosphate aldolase